MSTPQKLLIALLVITLAAAAWLFVPRGEAFCFDFLRDMYYGENKTLENPVNTGIMGQGGITYFPIETQALHKALKKEGYYIDPVEETGGGIYLTSFFGPSTNVATKEFQKKYGLEETGIVDNPTADKLTSLYGCP